MIVNKWMTSGKTALVGAMLASWFLAASANAEDYRAYYEKQKAGLKKTFVAPAVGSEVKLLLLDGEEYTGSLKQLTEGGVQILSDEITLSFRKHELDKTTCVRLFAEEYAHAVALEKTRAYKKNGGAKPVKHIAVLNVKDKVERSIEKEGSEEETDSGTWLRELTTKTSIQNLEISVANMTSHPDTFTLAWYFFSEEIDGEGIRIHSQGSEIIEIGSKKKLKRSVKSDEYIARRKTDNFVACCGKATDNEKKDGLDDKGYLVVVKCGDKVIARKASSKAYLNVDWVTLCRQNARLADKETR